MEVRLFHSAVFTENLFLRRQQTLDNTANLPLGSIVISATVCGVEIRDLSEPVMVTLQMDKVWD